MAVGNGDTGVTTMAPTDRNLLQPEILPKPPCEGGNLKDLTDVDIINLNRCETAKVVSGEI
jgi:hypothetical protein